MLEALAGVFKWAALVALIGAVGFFMVSNNNDTKQRDVSTGVDVMAESINCDYYRSTGDTDLEKECRTRLAGLRDEHDVAHKAATKRQDRKLKQGDQVVDSLMPKSDSTQPSAEAAASQAGKPTENPF